ncbi:MAG: hypothetical protein U0575_10815 [Phycisphaerales bacterium]
MAEQSPAILFTAFEPSGDALAAPVIAALRRLRPDLRVYAVGGPRMEAAGAAIVERTSDDGSMGLGAVGKAASVRGVVARIKRWSAQYRVVCHVAVDSPAANFPIARIMRARGARVVHLAAPQLWAWGAWRLGKLKKLTSVVLCLLPFEKRWFTERGVPARFIGHPVLNRVLDERALAERAAALPRGGPKVAILPGSRSSEVARNIRLLVAAFIELQGRHGGMAGVIVAANPGLAAIVRRKVPVFPTGLHMISGSELEGAEPSATTPPTTGAAGGAAGAPVTSGAGVRGLDAAIRWCDLALCVSGTVTLDVARQCKPMIGVYRTSLASVLGAKVLLRTPFRLLPNIIAGREICPEFVPHAGGAGPVVHAAGELLRDSRRLAQQSEELARIVKAYEGHHPAEEAAEAVLQLVDGRAAGARG